MRINKIAEVLIKLKMNPKFSKWCYPNGFKAPNLEKGFINHSEPHLTENIRRFRNKSKIT